MQQFSLCTERYLREGDRMPLEEPSILA